MQNFIGSFEKMSWGTIGIFPVLLIALFWASVKMVKWSEVLIAKTKFGGGFIGGTLIATITSMPEMITEITQGLAGTPENGLADDIGSNSFSVLLIGIGAFIFWKYAYLNKLGKWTKTSMMISMGLSLILAILLLVNRLTGFADIPGWTIGVVPAAFFIFYLISIWLSYKYEDVEEPIDENWAKKQTLKKGLLMFTMYSLLLIGFAVLVNVDMSAFQNVAGIPSESIGGVFLAITTSLPEIVAFFIFMKKRLPAAALASAVGSHFFNLGIMFFGDLAFQDGPTFNDHEMARIMPLAIMTALMLMLLIGHTFFARRHPHKFEQKKYYLIFPSLVIATYIIGWVIILTVLR